MRGMHKIPPGASPRRKTALLLILLVLTGLLLARCAPFSGQIVPSAVGTLTPTPLPTEIPLLPTAMPQELARSSELTNNIVLVGVLLVVTIVGGTFYGIRRRRREE